MLRASRVRAISSYEFGHPNMTVTYLPEAHKMSRNKAIDQGVQVLQAANGARIITHNRQGAQSSVGVFVQAGAKQDPRKAPGLNYVMRWALTGSNFSNSLFQMDRTIRAVGASIEHGEVEKKWLGWKIEACANNWQKPVEDILTCMAIPRFPEYDIERFRDTFDNMLEETRWQNPRLFATDSLETVAFQGEPLGNPRFVPPEHNDEASHKNLVDQWAALCTPSRIVVAGINIDVDELAAAYEHAPFSHSELAPHHKSAKKNLIPENNEMKQWYGGNDRHHYENRPGVMGTIPDMAQDTTAAVGFLAHGGRQNLKKYVTGLIAQQLFDHSTNDCLRVDRGQSHYGLRSFYRPFTTAGMVGFTARDAPANIEGLVKSGMSTFKGLEKSTAADVHAAQQRAKSALFQAYFDVGRDSLDFLVANISDKSTSFVGLDEHLAAIDAIKPADVKKFIEEGVASKPALFATGATNELPSLKYLH